MPALCRDCLRFWEDDAEGAPAPDARRCPACGHARLVAHPDLGRLSIAHVDADAFYAAVEKRDDPALADRPVIVGGAARGVVTTCCYIARTRGVRSAVPMTEALARCPDAVVIRPRFDAYAGASRAIRAEMDRLTPLVEPLALDEAFLDLSGTERLFGAPPALGLARLAARIEDRLGLTVSVGLGANKFLAKLASEMDKPRGFAVVGAAEAAALLAPRPVSALWGVGAATAARLEREGYCRCADLARADPGVLRARLGALGPRLVALARGEDARPVTTGEAPRSLSAETTFETDLAASDPLEGHLWRLAVRVSDRAKAKGLGGAAVVLKLRTARFRAITRQARLPAPTASAELLYEAGASLLHRTLGEGPFRLIGIGLTQFAPVASVEGTGLDLDGRARFLRAEAVTDRIRARFGGDAIVRGRALR